MNTQKKICPLTLLLCQEMLGDHPCAWYEEKRKCCAVIQKNPVIVIPAGGKPITAQMMSDDEIADGIGQAFSPD